MPCKTLEAELFVRKYFKKNEILSLRTVKFTYEKKVKIIVFIPVNNALQMMKAMASAGAGNIGNYSYCSFNSFGSGSFKPSASANPTLGNKNVLSFVDEIKLEMECDPKKLDKVLDVMLKENPYEEPAYEIHEFTKRTKKPAAMLLELKKKITFRDLITRFNKKIDLQDKSSFKTISSILFHEEENLNNNSDVIIKRDMDICTANNRIFNLNLK